MYLEIILLMYVRQRQILSMYLEIILLMYVRQRQILYDITYLCNPK